MAAEISRSYPEAEVVTMPGGRGDFLVRVDGSEIWDKRKLGRFPEHSEITDALQERAPAAPTA